MALFGHHKTEKEPDILNSFNEITNHFEKSLLEWRALNFLFPDCILENKIAHNCDHLNVAFYLRIVVLEE